VALGAQRTRAMVATKHPDELSGERNRRTMASHRRGLPTRYVVSGSSPLRRRMGYGGALSSQIGGQ